MENNALLLSTDSSDEQGFGSGAYSLAGYDYQVDVSVWLALDLILASGLTQTVELEPGSEEDFEAQLACDEPGRVATSVELDDYTLVVQAKLRRGDAWTVNGVLRLLKHGSDTRISAAKRLINPKVRYLLVTSSALNGKTRDLAVKRAGTWPNKNTMPASIISSLPKDPTGRIAIIGNLDEERLVGEIRRLLVERFGIPNSRWVECLKVLRQEAHLRVRRVAGGLWRKEDLTHIIRQHDGYLASSPELDDYVYPRNWQFLRDAMRARYAAIIIGQSGTGKTLATRKLYEELRREHPGLVRVKIKGGPQELRDDCTPSPVLYDIEDPWGRYSFDSSSRDWNEELSKLFAQARADKMIIATSRRDVAMASGALESVKSWVVKLEAEHYGKTERKKIYQTRIKTLPRDIQLVVAEAEAHVLDKLGTPLEIAKFFDAMRTMGRPDQNKERFFINDAIDKAHEQSIESTVIQQIEHRNDIQPAAIIWGFLKASDALSIQLLRDIELKLADRDVASDKGIIPTIDFFVAARNLRSDGGSVSYYHPRVEAGLERILKRNRVPVNITLRKLLDALTDPEDSEEDFWGIAARIVAAANRIPDLALVPEQHAANKIDTWLEARVNDPSCKLIDYLRLAAVAGSHNSNTAEFARYLLHRPDKSFGGFHLWGIPNHPDSWYEHMRLDSTIANIAERFIIEMLPNESDHYVVSFVDDLERMAPNLTHAYLKAAANIVNRGVTYSSDVIAAGALRDLGGFESIVDAAVVARTPTHDEQVKAIEINLNIINEVYNDDYAEFASENDDGYTAGEFLKHYADKVRKEFGWCQLVQHRHAAVLMCYWMRSFYNDALTEPPSGNETAGAFKLVFGTDEEDTLWRVLTNHWDERYKDELISRILAGSPYINVRRTATTCFLKNVTGSLANITNKLLEMCQYERVVELMIDLANIIYQTHPDTKKYKDMATTALNSLEPELQELCIAASNNTSAQKLHPLSSKAIALLIKPLPLHSDVCALRIRRQLDLSGDVRADIEHVLASSDDNKICIEAIDAAITLGMVDIVRGALDHKFAHVVARALVSVGSEMAAPLPAELLSLAEAKGSPIRKALVQILYEKSHIDHLAVLLCLIKDEWSLSSQRYGENDHFPIARVAVDAIRQLDFLSKEILEQLQDIAIETSDWVVRANLFEVIVEKGGDTFHQRLFEIAVTPGRVDVKRAAAYAMLTEFEILDLKVVHRISVNLLATQDPLVAVILTIIYACRAQLSERLKIAQELSANHYRRALILLMLWPKVSPCEQTKLSLKQFLPDGHPSIEWVNSGPVEYVDDCFIADLGTPDICQEVLRCLNPKKA